MLGTFYSSVSVYSTFFCSQCLVYYSGKKLGALCTLYSSAVSVSCRQQILGCVALVTPREAGLVLDDIGVHPNTSFPPPSLWHALHNSHWRIFITFTVVNGLAIGQNIEQ